jgi:uncharacterized protein (TIGR03067 family)
MMKELCLMGLALAVGGSAFAVDPKPLTLRFGKEDLDKVPAGWKADKTGKGEGSVWKVVADPTAPSKSGYVLAQTAESPSALFNLCVAEKTDAKDLEVKVSFKAVKGKADQGGGIVWRYQDAKNYYIARMNPLEDNFRLYKVVDGQRKQLATTKDDVTAKAGEWHTLSVKHVGNQIECSLNGKRYLEAKDDTFPRAGKVGLWTKADAQTYFDDLQIVTRAAAGGEAKTIEGAWVPVAGELGGKPLPEEFLKSIRLVVTGDNYSVKVGEQTDKGTFKLHPTESPQGMDIIGTDGPNKGKTIKAIYELSDDSLKVCYALEGEKRPAEFKSTAENKFFLLTYKRQKN